MPVNTEVIDATSIRPMRDEIFVKLKARQDKIGSVYIPDDVENQQQYATVLAVGPGEPVAEGERLKPKLQVGDEILIAFKWERNFEHYGLEGYATVRDVDVIGKRLEDGSLELLYNQVSVLPDKVEEKHGLLYIPQSVAREKKTGVVVTGTVVDVGPGHRLKDGTIKPLDVTIGDKVLYSPFAGEQHSLEENGAKLQLLPEEHIVAVLA